MSGIVKPFYLQPPWDILFDPQRLQKVNPWSIKVAFILLSFLEEMEKRAVIDFRASGVALDSSALIYLLKSNFLLKTEGPQLQSKPAKIGVDIVPPLVPPLRYELTTTTLQSLLEALDQVLQDEVSLPLKVPQKPLIPHPEVIPTLSTYLMEIEENIEEMLHKIKLLIEKGEVITFSKLVTGLNKFEMIRVFIILLFMAQRGKVTLWQKEEFGEIYVTLNAEGGQINGNASS